MALAGYLLMLRAPSLRLMSVLKVAANSIDYSLGNTTKQALWLPTSSFFMRMGDVIQAGLAFVGERLGSTLLGFAAVNVLLVGGWLAAVTRINVTLRRRAEEARTAAL